MYYIHRVAHSKPMTIYRPNCVAPVPLDADYVHLVEHRQEMKNKPHVLLANSFFFKLGKNWSEFYNLMRLMI